MESKLEMMKRELEQMKKYIVEQEKKIAAEELASKCEHDWEEPKLIKDRDGKLKKQGILADYVAFVDFFNSTLWESSVVFQRRCKKCGKVEQTNRFVTKYVPQWDN